MNGAFFRPHVFFHEARIPERRGRCCCRSGSAARDGHGARAGHTRSSIAIITPVSRYIKALGTHDGKKLNGYTTWFALDRLKDYTVQQDWKRWIATAGYLHAFVHHAGHLVRQSRGNGYAGARDERFGARTVNDHKGASDCTRCCLYRRLN